MKKKKGEGTGELQSENENSFGAYEQQGFHRWYKRQAMWFSGRYEKQPTKSDAVVGGIRKATNEREGRCPLNELLLTHGIFNGRTRENIVVNVGRDV